MPDHLILVALLAVKIAAILHRFRIGKVGDLAIEAAAAGHIQIVGAGRKERDDRVQRKRPDVRIAACGASFADDCAWQFIVDKLILCEQTQALGEVIAAAGRKVSSPPNVTGGVAGRAVGAAASLKGQMTRPAMVVIAVPAGLGAAAP